MQDKPGKILVIDDDPDFVDTVRIALEHAGHQVLTATNGAAGMDAARRAAPDVVVVDLLMGPKDGFTVCAGLRSWPGTRRAAILVVSAIGQKMHKTFASPDVGARLDVDGFLDKPVQLDVLVRRVGEMLSLARSRTRSGEEPT